MKVLDLFSGIGGFSLGLEKSGMETIAFCEIDKDCHKVLQKHWPTVPIFKDIKTFNGIKADIICGGFPCQNLSVGGKKEGLHGDRSGLWFEYLRLIGEVKPRWVIIENVSRLVDHGLEEVLEGLSKEGYDAEWHVVEATHVGLPHRRERVYIIAHSRSIRLYERIREERHLQSDERWENTETYNKGEKRFTESFQICPILSSRDFDNFRSTNTDLGASLSDIRRVTNGIPSKPHEADRKRRIKQLGNAIVPQIAEIIGKRIMEIEQALRS